MTDIVIIAPHPDDETLACGGVIQTAARNNESILIVSVNNGDGHPSAASVHFKCAASELTPDMHQEFASIIQKEFCDALQILGLDEKAATFLGYPGGGQLYEVAAAERDVVRSRFTGLDHTFSALFVDYHTLKTGKPALYTRQSLKEDLASILQEHQPKKLFVPHRADGHWDHQAVNALLEEVYIVLEKPTDVYYYLIHSGIPTINKYKRYWPNPAWPAARATPTIPYEAVEVEQGRFPLGMPWPPDARMSVPDPDQKRRAIEAYRSSRAIDSKDFLISFVKSDEIFWLRNKPLK